MGTLFDQDPRDYRRIDENYIDAFLGMAVKMSKKHNVTVADVIAAANVLELKRKNDLTVDNGNIFDEQMAGIGHILNDIDASIENLKS
jgi:hypothetical protein